MRRGLLLVTMATICASLLVSCSSKTSNLPDAPAINATSTMKVGGSIDSAWETGAAPNSKLILANSSGQIVARGTTDRFGSLIIRNLPPKSGYTFRYISGKKVFGSKSLTVLSTSYVPPTSLYTSQPMHVGLNYIKMRDGIYLAATVRLPPGKTLADGPFPTVIEYSGYQTAAPGNLINALLNPGKSHTPSALLPDTATAVGSIIAPLLGFASVSLQMRGTGCSGGAFDLFGLSTIYDGYDAVETVAHQSWVKNHKVGLVGISFSGISQLSVAGTRPPGLAAIAPLSTTNDLYATGYPGGIFNSGFAASWIAARFADAQPAPQGGQAYAKYLVTHGDKQCTADQLLRLQTQSVESALAEAKYRNPSLYQQRSPQYWAAKVKVPVFIAGAFQDEQTGGQWPDMLPAFKNNPDVWATITNGTHADSLGPAILARWLEFLDIFVAKQVPKEPGIVRLFGNQLYQRLVGAPAEPFPAVKYTNAKTVAQARAEFIKDNPRVTILFDNGGGSLGPGALQPGWQAGFSQWPPKRTKVTYEYLGPNGTLSTLKPHSGSVSFYPNPKARPSTDLVSGSVWQALPKYDWTPITGNIGLGFISPVLKKDITVAGPCALDVWVKSSAANTDLQATVSEVRPDGQEMFMNSGTLRASLRYLDKSKSTILNPVPTYEKRTQSPMPKGKFVELQIPITPFAYTFRAGSRIRVTIEAPGGDRPIWEYLTFQTNGKVKDSVGYGSIMPSALVLPVIPSLEPTDPQPACPSLRGQPCRNYIPAGNGG